MGALSWIPWGVLAGVPVGCKVRTDQMGAENGFGFRQCVLLESGQDVAGKLSGGTPSSPRASVYSAPHLVSEGMSLCGCKCGTQPAAECTLC